MALLHLSFEMDTLHELSVVITGRYAFYGLEQYYYCVTPTADTMYLLQHIVDEDAQLERYPLTFHQYRH